MLGLSIYRQDSVLGYTLVGRVLRANMHANGPLEIIVQTSSSNQSRGPPVTVST